MPGLEYRFIILLFFMYIYINESSANKMKNASDAVEPVINVNQE